MDHAPVPLALGALASLIATAFGALPERIDLTFVLGAYGAGTMIGEAVATRPGRLPPGVYAHRWGGWLMGFAGLIWALGMLRSAIP
jgi:hypothetical protein